MVSPLACFAVNAALTLRLVSFYPDGQDRVVFLRKETMERVFADAKDKHGMRYTHRRGLARVSSWVRLKFAALDLKKLALCWASHPFLYQLFACISTLFLTRIERFLTRRNRALP